ncbi:MAG: hypothetical protein K8S13_18460 [Desulfobacula sp.]|uniref:hypothetical protein n=1 Tax=Desulfobacula sp. TaxID=2593537 RepID=UPI0025C3E7EB|nr:hypothetical protein [Desulfobacula sp.]MCD4721818.1 hypothetical protein [Desulfobacula sp.]
MPFSSENIEIKSALIVINFKQWNPETSDPIEKVKEEQYIEDGYTLNGQHGLKEYIKILERERNQRNNS